MRILIIDDEESIRKTTSVCLKTAGHEPAVVASGAEALALLEQDPFDAALLDLKLNGESGLDLLPQLLRLSPGLAVVVFTAFASIDSAVEAMRRGAADYIPKPFTPEQVRQVLGKVFHARLLERRVEELESRLSAHLPAADLKSEEPAARSVLETAVKAAPSGVSILILGESGTGKTVLARVIHEHSPQRDRPFVTLHCPSVPRDLLESELFGHAKGAFTGATAETQGKIAAAEGGTLFLDEIGEMAVETQPKLLRFLETREYERIGETRVRRANVRIIAATNRNLETAVRDGRFREDLFYRLNVITLVMPPLRERPGDLMRLADGYLSFFARQCGKPIQGFAPEVVELFRWHTWPGNLRELCNSVERAVILAEGRQVVPADLPEVIGRPAVTAAAGSVRLGGLVSLEALEEEHIRLVVQQAATLEEAARILQIDATTLYRKRKRMAGAAKARPPAEAPSAP